jgi:hypothetical protein
MSTQAAMARRRSAVIAGLLAAMLIFSSHVPLWAAPSGPTIPLLPAPAQVDDLEESEEVPAEQTGLYRGVVTNRKSGKPVKDAVVIFMNEETGDIFEITTDSKGAYEARLPAGEYLVDIRVGRKTYRSTGTFREEAVGKRWVMDFTVGSKLTEKDVKISTTPSNIRIIPTEPRPPLEPSRKMTELWIFIGGLLSVAALSD